MTSLPFFIAVGPGLMMALAALALVVVTLGLSRTPHALLWTCGSVMGALHWAAVAARGDFGAVVGPPALGLNLLALAALVFFTEGFRQRRAAGHARPAPMLIATAGAAALLVAGAALPGQPLQWAAYPLCAMTMLAWAAALVVRPGTPPSRTEVVAITILLAIAATHLARLLLVAGEQLGRVGSHQPFSDIYLIVAEPAAAGLALAILMLIAFDYATELRRLLHTDPLTGVLNRQGFEHAIRRLVERRPRRLSVALADLDLFKDVNDAHGHAVGDATLTAFAGHLAGELGREGTVARIGGEEFAILLPNLDGPAACHRVDALRAGLAALSVVGRPELRVAASFGVAERRAREALDAVIERADAALYRSKREGRDRVTLAGAETAP